MKHCPNCITELKPNRKKLGYFIRWLVCPSCGFRARPDDEVDSPSIIKRINNNKRILDDEANGYFNES